MKLSEFVRTTLQEIIVGVTGAQEFSRKHGGTINPQQLLASSGMQDGFIHERTRQFVGVVKFDVAVTKEEGTETKGGVGVLLGAVGLGSQGRSQDTSAAVTRVSFTVPLMLPEQKPD